MRESCPCRVGLDYSLLLQQASPGEMIITTISDAGGKMRWQGEFLADTCPVRYGILLAKGQYTASSLLFGGDRNWSVDENEIKLREGAEADSLFGEAAPLDARGEEAESVPAALKQFATLFIRFGAPVSGLEVEVGLNSSSIASRDLSAAPGPMAIKRTVSGEMASFRLPRQCDTDISVAFNDKADGRLLAALDLSPLLQKRGYDFKAPELSDIFLDMDFEARKATIEVEGWKESFIIVTF